MKNHKRTAPIGIFDSGVGGLTVAKAIEELLPSESFLYFGDTLHMPYGQKSKEELIGYCERIVTFFLEKKVKMIVIACNSASAQAASFLRQKYHPQVEIQGVITPIIEEAIRKNYKKVGIIGTETTIASGIYEDIFKKKKSPILVQSIATPELASMIEHDMVNFDNQILHDYLDRFSNIDAILLGCTHYPLIAQNVSSFFNHSIDVLDNSSFMAHAVKKYLNENDLLSNNTEPSRIYYVSKLHESFKQTASLFYGRAINVIEENIFAT